MSTRSNRTCFFFEFDLELATGDQLITALAQRGVLMQALSRQRIRACTHLDVTQAEIDQAAVADALEQKLRIAATEPAPHPLCVSVSQPRNTRSFSCSSCLSCSRAAQ
ncbi:MAG TPA: hypothetical protein VMM56_06960 [Planctomycetaceae bacterium]|nr:hypothetical protein [Planctomycetaceae bacterium]